MAWSLARKRFVAALGVFVLWVAALCMLAWISARPPAARDAPVEGLSPAPGTASRAAEH